MKKYPVILVLLWLLTTMVMPVSHNPMPMILWFFLKQWRTTASVMGRHSGSEAGSKSTVIRILLPAGRFSI